MNRWMTRSLAILTVFAMVFLAACGAGGDSNKEAKDQVLNLGYMASEPPSLDPAKATDDQSGIVLRHVMEGLANVDEEGNPTPGVAEKWEESKDGTKFTFHLRDAKWSNGDPVKASDFEYAWKHVLDPETAAEYANQLFYLKNGEKYNAGKAKAEDVGVKALDDKTLEVELEKPTPYFVALTAFYTLLPVNEKVAKENDKWHSEAKSYVSNGAFTLDEWKHDSKITLKKNKDYWQADKVKLTQINLPFHNDQKTAYQLYQSGELDAGNSNTIPTDMTKKLLDDGKAKRKDKLGTYAYLYNVEEKPFNNAKIRKAFSMALDRQAIVDEILQNGAIPANGWVPKGMPDFDSGKDWTESHDEKYIEPTPQAKEAKKLLKEGMKEEGWDKLPTVSLEYNTDEGHKKIAEAAQQMIKKNLGVDVKLSNSEWKVFLEKLNTGDFQMARYGWLPDYIDPMSYMDMWVTGDGNNSTNFSNKEYDKLIKEAKSTNDQKKRMAALHKAEDILMDEMPFAPVYYYAEVYQHKDNVKNIIIKKDSSWDLRFAYLTE